MTMVGVIVVVVVVVLLLGTLFQCEPTVPIRPLLLRLLLHDDHVSRVTENWKLQGTGPVPSSTKTLNWHSDFSSQNISIFVTILIGCISSAFIKRPFNSPYIVENIKSRFFRFAVK